MWRKLAAFHTSGEERIVDDPSPKIHHVNMKEFKQLTNKWGREKNQSWMLKIYLQITEFSSKTPYFKEHDSRVPFFFKCESLTAIYKDSLFENHDDHKSSIKKQWLYN